MRATFLWSKCVIVDDHLFLAVFYLKEIFWLGFPGCDASKSICALKIASINLLFEIALGAVVGF